MEATSLILHVRIFNGKAVSQENFNILLDGGKIIDTDYRYTGEDVHNIPHIDGRGGVLMPGFIDGHVHIRSGERALIENRNYGVTTVLDMACHDIATLKRLRNISSLPSVLSAGTPANLSTKTGQWLNIVEEEALDVPTTIAERVREGSDYIKIILRAGMSLAKVTHMVQESHAHGKIVVAHATTCKETQMAIDTGVDIITHVALDKVIDLVEVERMARESCICIPTLTMMEAVTWSCTHNPSEAFGTAQANVRQMHKAGISIIAGTDANDETFTPAQPPHGVSMHHELELLVMSGLEPIEALRAATSVPAEVFGLMDRGAIQPGLRADLVLVANDPTEDIRATQDVKMVWIAGVPYAPFETGLETV